MPVIEKPVGAEYITGLGQWLYVARAILCFLGYTGLYISPDTCHNKCTGQKANPIWVSQVTDIFLLYVLADFIWIIVQPSTLPSAHALILGHHAVTILLLTFPLRHPDLARFTCWDGLTEINTFFLVARRQFPAYFRALHL